MILVILLSFLSTPQLKEVARWGFGPVLTVDYSGDTAFVGSGAGLYVLIDEGDNYRVLDRLSLKDDVIDLNIHDGTLFVAEESYGVECFALKNGKLKKLRHIKTPGKAYRVIARRNKLIVALREGGLAVYTKGLTGLSLEHLFLKGYEVTSVVTINGLLVVGAADSGVFVFDEKTFELLANKKFEDSVEDLDLIGDSLVAATLWNGVIKFIRVDKQYPNPTVLASSVYHDCEFYLVDAAVVNSNKMVAVGYKRDLWAGVVEIIDISDNYSPMPQKVYEYSRSFIQSVKPLNDSTVYLACDYGGLRKVIVTPQKNSTIWHMLTPGYSMASEVIDDSTLVVGGKMGKLIILTMNDNFEFSEKFNRFVADEIYDVAAYRGSFFVAAGKDGLIFPRTNELDSTSLKLDTLSSIEGIVQHLTLDTARKYLYTANNWGGAYIVNVRDPQNPSEIYKFDFPYFNSGYISDIERYGNLFYLLTFQGNVMAYRREAPDDKHILYEISTGSWGYDMEIYRGYIYVASDDSGLTVLKIKGDSLEFVKRIVPEGFDGFSRYISIQGHYLFMAGIAGDFENGWVYMFDLRDPENPELIPQKISLPGLGERIVYWPAKNLIIVTTFNTGLIFYRPHGFDFNG